MADEKGTARALMERIRSDSAETKLTPASGLTALTEGGGDPAAVLEAEAEEDIRMLRGASERYYFSDRSMTETYAKHLFRLAERDPARLIADTVRDESRIYPRPTPLETFTDPPFLMSRADVDAAVESIAAAAEYADIRPATASDGSRFLYSAEHLAAAHAEALAEWIAVGEKENP